MEFSPFGVKKRNWFTTKLLQSEWLPIRTSTEEEPIYVMETCKNSQKNNNSIHGVSHFCVHVFIAKWRSDTAPMPCKWPAVPYLRLLHSSDCLTVCHHQWFCPRPSVWVQLNLLVLILIKFKFRQLELLSWSMELNFKQMVTATVFIFAGRHTAKL